MEHEEVKHKAVRGIVALTGRTVLLQAIGAVAFFLLGIFLSPSAIGVYIIVSSVMRILTLFTDVGLGAALVQKKEELDSGDLRTAFTIQELLVIPIVLIGWAISPYVARYAHLGGDGVFLYQVLVLTLFISSLKVIPSILLERKLAFEQQVFPQIVEALVFNVLVVILAFKGFGVTSYSWAVLASALAGLPIYYLISPWKIGLGILRSRARHLLSYGVQYQGKTILSVIKDDLLTFFLAGLVGTTGVGYWGFAQRWSYFPFRFIVDSVTKVTFPAYARLQHDQALLRVAIERSLFGVSALLFPILTLLATLVPGLIHLIPRYGKWEPAIVSFWFLCGAAAISSLSNILVNALDATGRVRLTLGLMVMWIILTWGLTVGLVWRYGFSGIAAAAFLVSLTIVVTVWLVKRVIKFSFLGNIYQPVIACSVMALGVVLVERWIAISYFQVIMAGLVGSIIYAVMMLIMARTELVKNAKVILRAYNR